MLTHAGKYYDSLLGEANIVATVRFRALNFFIIKTLLIITRTEPNLTFKFHLVDVLGIHKFWKAGQKFESQVR